MIEFVKRAVNSSLPDYKVNQQAYLATTCFVVSMINENIPIVVDGREVFDVVKIIRYVRGRVAHFVKESCKNGNELNPLDYAEIYRYCGGNPLVFLKNYQTNFGPIE